MGKIYTSSAQLIGHTPLLELSNIEKQYGLKAKLIAKLEYFNPSGSVKDRIAKAMIEDAEAEGKITPETVIIEPTSGNTGIGLAAVAAARGYRLIIVMPETMSVERRQLMKAYGAELVLTEGAKGMKGAIEKAQELAQEIPNSFIPGQFVNPSNPKAHRSGTGPEIYADTDGMVDIFVAGVGTGGTITGVGEYLKARKPEVKVVAVEPEDSPVLSSGRAGAHKIQGIGAGFVPDILNTHIYDEVISISNEAAFAASRLIGKRKEFLLEFLQVLQWLRPLIWLVVRNMKEKRLLCFFQIPGIDIYPLRCLQKNKLPCSVHSWYDCPERGVCYDDFNEGKICTPCLD